MPHDVSILWATVGAIIFLIGMAVLRLSFWVFDVPYGANALWENIAGWIIGAVAAGIICGGTVIGLQWGLAGR